MTPSLCYPSFLSLVPHFSIHAGADNRDWPRFDIQVPDSKSINITLKFSFGKAGSSLNFFHSYLFLVQATTQMEFGSLSLDFMYKDSLQIVVYTKICGVFESWDKRFINFLCLLCFYTVKLCQIIKGTL